MKGRCYCRTDPAFHNYGGRGITVCDRWRNDFTAFLADMGPKPTRSHSIDRIDNDGNYEPGNCRWATAKEQARNNRSNVMLTAFGETMCVAEWAERSGLARQVIYRRVKDGLPAERAVTEPIRGVHESKASYRARFAA